MAEILIKGMEMPTSCCECAIKSWDGEDDVCPFSGISALSIGRQDDCPLVPVPEHGRLIDADAFKKYISVGFDEVAPELSGGYSWLAKQLTEDLIKDIDDAPTVIPADVTDTNVGKKEKT